MPSGMWVNWLFLALLGFIWGASFLGVEVALEGFGPLTVAALRILIGAFVLLVVARITGDGLPSFAGRIGKRAWLHCLGFAIFTNALPFALLSWGQLRVTSGFAGITMAVVPLFVLPLAWVVLKEPMGPRKIVGFLLGFAGVIILVGIDSLGGLSDGLENLARLACVGASLCYALGTMVTRTAPPMPLFSYSSAGLLIGSLIMVPLALIVEGWPQGYDWRAVAGVIYLGLLPTALATVMLVRVVNSAGPTFMSLVNYQVPVWAVVNGLVFLGEELPPSFVTALLVILAGLAVSEAKARRFRP